MKPKYSPCPICRYPADVGFHPGGTHEVDCFKCGIFSIYDGVSEPSLDANQRGNASGFLREHPNFHIETSNDVEKLKSIQTPSVGAKALKLLRALEKESPVPGEDIRIYYSDLIQFERTLEENPSKHEFDYKDVREIKQILPLIGASWSQDYSEMRFLVMDYLADTKKWTKISVKGTFARISGEGWEYLWGERGHDFDSKEAFVAMWFNEATDNAYEEAIKSAIDTCGFIPIRIDGVEHNNSITDEIIASIRRSRFVIADFTGQRGGVYFEAGFAKGLGKEVIWLCDKNEKDDLHFDTRQYNHIFWSSSDLKSLKKKLEDRIEAIFGSTP